VIGLLRAEQFGGVAPENCGEGLLQKSERPPPPQSVVSASGQEQCEIFGKPMMQPIGETGCRGGGLRIARQRLLPSRREKLSGRHVIPTAQQNAHELGQIRDCQLYYRQSGYPEFFETQADGGSDVFQQWCAQMQQGVFANACRLSEL